GRRVSSVELAGRPDVDVDHLMQLVSQRAGEPLAQQKIDQSITALKKTGKFQDVELQVLPDPQGVRVLFVLQPAMYYGIYEFPGAVGRFSYSRLLQVANYPPRSPFTQADVQAATESLLTFFKRNGYFLAEIKPEAVTDPESGLVNLIFHTALNRRAKFGKAYVTGPSEKQAQELESKLHSVSARVRGAAIRRGKTYKLKTLTNATQYL